MAVAFESYSVSVSWTATQFFDALEAAFIDAGYCTAAYDRFTSGSYAHMVIELVYDGTKTYGKRYYRFLLSGGYLYLSIANGWNAATHAPTGTNYVDYHNNTSQTTTNGFWQFAALSTSTSCLIKRYTSSVDPDFSAFVVANGSNNFCFWMVPPGAARQPWVDLAKTSFGMIHHPSFYTVGHCQITFPFNLAIQRDCYAATGMRGGITHDGQSTNWWHSHYRYLVTGRADYTYGGNWMNNSTTLPFSGSNLQPQVFITLPTNDAANNPSYTSDKAPIFSGVPYNAYLQDSLPADFGITGLYYNTSTAGSQLIVQAGTEEWEILALRNNTNSPGTTYPSGAFVARTV